MSDQQTVELLERVTDTLPTAGPDLVAGAVARGRRQRRRHLAGTAAAAVAVLGLGGAGLTVALSGAGGDGARAVDPATPSHQHRTTKAPSPAIGRWALAVQAAQVPQTFGSLVPGAITTVPNKEMDDADPIVDFRWNGYAVRVGLVSDSYVTGKRVPDPRKRCEELGSEGPCTPGRLAGSYEQAMTWTGPAADGGVTVSNLTVYFAEGWDVTVTEANAADTKNSPALSPDVPLSMDQLREVAYSDVWFQ
jgi:hypothetical protein